MYGREKQNNMKKLFKLTYDNGEIFYLAWEDWGFLSLPGQFDIKPEKIEGTYTFLKSVEMLDNYQG